MKTTIHRVLLFACLMPHLLTAEEPVLVKALSLPAWGMAALDQTLLFHIYSSSPKQPWRSDGTTAGTFPLKNIDMTGEGKFIVLGGTAFFVATDVTHGGELWKTDGTTAGTLLVKDILPGTQGSQPTSLVTLAGSLYFLASDHVGKSSLWKSDGTHEGTLLVKEVNTDMTRIAVAGGKLFISVFYSYSKIELWKSDGTTEGTVLVQEPTHLLSSDDFTAAGNLLFFTATRSDNRKVLWKSDGTDAGTSALMTLPERAGIDYSINLTALDSQAFFVIQEESTGLELWKSDGTEIGTMLVKDIRPGPQGSNPIRLCAVDGSLFFGADDGTHGYELWRSDGTSGGTHLVKDITAGAGSSELQNLSAVADKLYLAADDHIHGLELWKSDGTSGGTRLVADLLEGYAGMGAGEMTVMGDHLYFTSLGGTIMGLWKYDMTQPEAPSWSSQPPSRLVGLGSPVSFSASASGTAPISLQWKKGTTNIAGATGTQFLIPSTKSTDAAAYTVTATNAISPPAVSSPAYLGLVTISHGVQALKVGSTLKLTCTVVAPKLSGVSVMYEWFRQGSADPITNGTKVTGAIVTGATTGALSIAKIGTADADTYTCRVTLDAPGNDPTLTNGDTVVRVVDAVPDVDAVPAETVSVSEPIDITITATNFPTSFSTTTTLPAGLKFDSKTGRLTGKPRVASKKNTLGAYIPSKISFKATNPVGTSLPEDFYLTIEPLEAGVVGTFSGVVARSNHSNFGMGGHVKITVASTGVITGDVTLAGQKHSLVGSLNVSLGNNPTFDLIVKRAPTSLGDLRLTGGISPSDDLLSGTITDDRFEMIEGVIDLGDPTEPDLINGTMQAARFNSPRSLVLRADGAGYVADTGNHVIRFVDPDSGEVSTFVGNPTAGSTDGTGTAASFNGPEGLALDLAGNVYIADTGNSTIRKITPAGIVTTFAGTAGQIGAVNGTGAAARFDLPCALCFDPAGNLIVADRGNHTIRKITQAGVVTTLAGKADQPGHKDGSGTGALFNTPRGIVYEPVLKALFVTDSENAVIRKVTLTGAATTYAGSPGVNGAADGLFANARFIDPRGITTLGDGTIIVTDTLLVQLNSNGTLGTISDFMDTVDRQDHPVSVAYNPADESLITVDDVLHGAISYELSGVNQEAHFVATRNPWSAASNVPLSQQGLYNAAIETTAAPGDATYPQGSGYAQVNISKTGTANWTGKAADGTPFTFGTFLDADLHIPLHASLYKNTGSLQGDTFINPATQDLVNHTTPAFDWYKIPQPLSSMDRSYKNGFYRYELEVSGGKYTSNDLHGYLGLSSSPAPMKLDFTGSLISTFIQSFTLTDPNTVSVPTPVKSMTLKIDPKTGIYTGSFKEGTPAVTVPFAGILIDYDAGVDQSGHGHYLLPESSAANAPIRSASMTLEAD